MNFELNRKKIITSISVGFLITLINYARQILIGINAGLINYLGIILVWPISAAIIYIIWGLFEKKK